MGVTYLSLMHDFLANIGLASAGNAASQVAVNGSLDGFNGTQTLVAGTFAAPQWGFAKFMNSIRASETTTAGFLGFLDFSASTFSSAASGNNSQCKKECK